MTIGALQRDMRNQLQAEGVETAALDARVLLQHALGKDHSYLISHYDEELSLRDLQCAQAVLRRRLAAEPVSRITGVREFHGLQFAVTSDVLDPRPDSEVLVAMALSACDALAPDGRPLSIIELGIGSGALVISVLMQRPNVTAIATDVSPAALQVARNNARRHGVDGRLELVCCNWLDAVREGFDLIISNPPYIATADIEELARGVKDFDPRLALDGGEDGLDAYRLIVPATFGALRQNGVLCVEVGAGQADDVWELLCQSGFRRHPLVQAATNDLAGHVRVVTGWKS